MNGRAAIQPGFDQGHAINANRPTGIGTKDDIDIEALLADFDENNFSTVFTRSGVPGVEFTTSYEVCLRPFLEALGWEGEDRQIVEALPYKQAIEDLDAFRAVISHLGFQSHTHKLRLREIDTAQLPAIVILDDDKPVILLSSEERGVCALFDPEVFDFGELALDGRRVTCCLAEPADTKRPTTETGKLSWFTSAAYSLRQPFGAIIGLTFAANLLALATPIYVMQVYNIVIGKKNPETLGFILASVLLILALEVFLKRTRGKLLAYFGARLSAGVMNAGFNRLLGLPLRMIEAAPIGTQITRLKQFEGTHAIFTGSIGIAFLDLPFLLVFFGAILVISPPLALVPVALAIVFTVLALIAVPGARRRNAELSSAVAASNSFLSDAFGKRASIQELRGESQWQQRFIGISRDLAHRRYRVQFFDSMLGAISQALMMLAGAATLLIGATMVMAETLTVGGLIAIMMLIWRILAPIQSAFTNLNRISQFIDSVKQVDVLMQIPVEHVKSTAPTIRRSFRGRVTLANVSFRYPGQHEPVFKGLNLDVPPGQFVCVSGSTAGGKSTILKLILGLHQPQAGTVYLDGLNLQQLDPAEVRAAVTYLPLEPKLFYGTVSQNIRLGAPTATDEEIASALANTGLNMSSPMFPEGTDTRLTAETLETLPVGTLQRIAFARAWCRKSSIYLLNDPAANLDADGEKDLLRELRNKKGQATVILISNQPSHLRISDRVLTISRGAIAEDYAPQDRSADGIRQ